MGALAFAESGWIPDRALRLGIRGLLRQRLRECEREEREGVASRWLAELRASPIALATADANRQHYEVEAAFFEQVLGPRLKYSACLWTDRTQSLAQAEAAMLDLTCSRAGIEDGMSVLDLGCGWGSLSLWIADRYRRCAVVAVSNSKAQREFIEARAARLNLTNLRVVTADVNDFDPGERFSRVVSVEMFEHARNWELLLERIAGWLGPESRLFVHHFCHRRYAYAYEDRGAGDWMARHFFTGGIMPSEGLVRSFEGALLLERSWPVNGRHYQRTLDAWLANLDAGGAPLLRALEASYGVQQAPLWRQRWRLFLLACSELFGFRGGEEWYVAHHRLRPRGRS